MDTKGPLVSVNPEGNQFDTAQTLQFNCDDGGSLGAGCGAIYYTTDDAILNVDQFTVLTGTTLSFNSDVSLRFYAVDKLGNKGSIVSQTYTFDAIPPASVTGVNASIFDASVTLTWTNPAADFFGVTIRRSSTDFPSDSSSGDLVYDGNLAQFTDSGLTNGVVYYYTLFAHDALPNYAPGVNI